MKYLRYNEARETLIDKKMIFLEDIAGDMRDAGMDVKIFNGSDNRLIGTKWMWMASGCTSGPSSASKYIYTIIKINRSSMISRSGVITRLVDTPELKEFVERLKDSGLGFRFMTEGETYGVNYGGDGVAFSADSNIIMYVVIGIDKRSRLSREEIQNLIS
jgi:hypothetical protein